MPIRQRVKSMVATGVDRYAARLCWVESGQERLGENDGWSAASTGRFCICVMHPYLCLCGVYLLLISVPSSPNTSSWLWHVLHCLALAMSFVPTFALPFAIWSIISCFLILAPPSSHLPSGCSTLLFALQLHRHNYVVPYTAGGVGGLRYFFRKQGCDVHKSCNADATISGTS